VFVQVNLLLELILAPLPVQCRASFDVVMELVHFRFTNSRG